MSTPTDAERELAELLFDKFQKAVNADDSERPYCQCF